MEEAGVRYYEKIKLFKQNAEDTTTLMNQQQYVIKSSL